MAKRTTKTTKSALKRITKDIGRIEAKEIQDVASIQGTVDVVTKKMSLVIGVLARNASKVKTLEVRVDNLEEVVSNVEMEGKGAPSALAESLSSIAKSLALVNKAITGVATPDLQDKYQTEQLEQSKPSLSTTPSASKSVAGGSKNESIFDMLKSLFTNPAVVAAMAGIVYSVLPKETQEKIKGFLGGFADGLKSATGQSENEGFKGLSTALKVAAGVIASVFTLKLIGSIAGAITTTIGIVKALRFINKKKALGAVAAAAAGAGVVAAMSDDEEEVSSEGVPSEALPESKPQPATTAAQPVQYPEEVRGGTSAPMPAATSPAPAPAPAPQTTAPATKPSPAATSGEPSSAGAPTGGRFKSPREFHTVMMPWAEYASQKLGGKVPPMAIMGQWAGESGNGSALPADFNYAGIKAGTKYQKGGFVPTEERYTDAQLRRAQQKGEELIAVLGPNDKIRKKGRDVTVDEWYGKGAWQKAKDSGLNWVQVKSYFAKFRDLKDFTDSYVEFLKSPRYAKAIASTTAGGFGYEVAKAGYATASADTYGAKIAAYSAPAGGAMGTSPTLASTPVSPTPISGTVIATASQNIKTLAQPVTQVAAVTNNRTSGTQEKARDDRSPIPSPIANRGSLTSATRHSTAYV